MFLAYLSTLLAVSRVSCALAGFSESSNYQSAAAACALLQQRVPEIVHFPGLCTIYTATLMLTLLSRYCWISSGHRSLWRSGSAKLNLWSCAEDYWRRSNHRRFSSFHDCFSLRLFLDKNYWPGWHPLPVRGVCLCLSRFGCSLDLRTFQIKSGGHAFNSGFSSTPGVQISLQNFLDFEYDNKAQKVKLGSAWTWDAIYEKLQPKNVTVVGARIPGVGKLLFNSFSRA
jgi:hypothetical protein